MAFTAYERVPVFRGRQWIEQGWQVFLRSPVLWTAATATILGVAVVLHFIPGANFVLFTIFTPPLVAGMVLGCNELEAGRPLRASHFVAGFIGASGRRLTALGVLTLVAYGAIGVIVAALVAMTLGPQAVLHGDLSGANWMHHTLFWLVGLTLWGFVVAATWFSPPLIVLGRVGVIESVIGSWVAIHNNRKVTTRYALWLTLWSVVASVPLFLGWLVATPVMVASIYFGYRDLFGKSAHE
jgi:hypothetical protein